MKVKEVMSREPLTIGPEAPLGAAVDVMRMAKVRHLPVVDDTGGLMGIITDRDLRQAAFAPALAEHLSLHAQRRFQAIGQALENLRVRDFMTWAVFTTHPEATVAHAALIMFEKRVGSLPVVADGKLIGIVTERDLMGVLMKGQAVSHYDPEGYLW
jgi:acetoin utilization protein AcuB